jgi:hypothetical protein
MFHLSLRVAWRDSRWSGSVCQCAAGNAFCGSLDRIRQEKIPETEQALRDRGFPTLAAAELPPCKAESGAFMHAAEWSRVFSQVLAARQGGSRRRGVPRVSACRSLTVAARLGGGRR